MLFTQPIFFAFFLAVLALQWFVLRGNTARKVMLLIASYVFYAAWDPRFLSLIIISTGVDYVAALRIASSSTRSSRRAWLTVSMVSNLGMLGIFKYANFFADSLVELLDAFGMSISEVTLNITLPVGISFFTFQTMSYTIDVYRGTLEPRRKVLDLALFVAFFPQLVAGPIERAANFLPQLERRRLLSDVPWRPALVLFFVGFFKKTVFADGVGAAIDGFWADPSQFDVVSSYLAVLGYALQIYCDFSGYTDMAIAVAAMLGYRLNPNFDFPYMAASVTDFWRRWHMSLSSWLRDYLYVPLGGSRGTQLETYRNLMITMLLGGLWHGAQWTFVVWGGLHGAALSVERWWRGRHHTRDRGRWETPTLSLLLRTLATFTFVCLAWVFFRAVDFAEAWLVLTQLVGLGPTGPEAISRWVAAYLVVGGVLHWLSFRQVGQRLEALASSEVLAVGVGIGTAVAIALQPVGTSPFIYFQF